MTFLINFFCSIIIGASCGTDVKEIPDVPTVITQPPAVEPPVIAITEPIKNSRKISQESWDRAIALRPDLINVINEEFKGNMLWLGVMVALCHTESRCNNKAKSNVGAAGTWQWMKRSINAFIVSDCRDIYRDPQYQDPRYDPYFSSRCAARHLLQNLRIVKVDGDDCNIVGVGALRGYNEGPGNTNKARRKAKNPNDINSVADVSWKSAAFEKQTDQYVVKILRIWFREYAASNYFEHDDICKYYNFDLQGLKI